MFRTRSQGSIGDREKEAKFVQDRIDAVEKHFAELCTVFAAYTRKAARLRDKNDEVVKTIQIYADSEDINRSMSSCLTNFANTLGVVGDYRDAEVQRLNAKVVVPLSQYQNTCKRAKENVRNTFAARDEELKRKRLLEKVREENPKNQQRIAQAKTNLMKATVEVSRVVKGLEEQIDSFEKQKLHDVKTIMTNFITVQLSFHAKAVELLTKAYQDVAEMDELHDLENYQLARGELNREFRTAMKSQDSSSSASNNKRSGGFRQSYSLMNLNNRSSPSPTSLRKQKMHRTSGSLDSTKTAQTNSSESVEIEEYNDSDSDDSEETSSIRDKKLVRSRLKTM
ncbi:protein FAM92A [Trichogramma pretiosum]|uniref:protein FAM92A n=1 Tax=Trichogramma pretiosum TaxID=7493 RepID=UPI0006C95493|nr:protein FAM92A [Trichogramma pretiosum]